MMRVERGLSSCLTGSLSLLPRLLPTPPPAWLPPTAGPSHEPLPPQRSHGSERGTPYCHTGPAITWSPHCRWPWTGGVQVTEDRP